MFSINHVKFTSLFPIIYSNSSSFYGAILRWFFVRRCKLSITNLAKSNPPWKSGRRSFILWLCCLQLECGRNYLRSSRFRIFKWNFYQKIVEIIKNVQSHYVFFNVYNLQEKEEFTNFGNQTLSSSFSSKTSSKGKHKKIDW